MENHILVQIDPDMDGAPIVKVIRSYLSNSRAMEDLALLEETAPRTSYRVITVEHIDN